ncbi:MAG: hypothetical protein J0I06_07640 [Planctomycetes bacterium]|nr:hypothetical protein [Planctomycetota bacterium]
MPPTPSRSPKFARRAFRWTLVAFLALQVLLSLVVEVWHPELADPQYGHRLKVLRAKRAAEPDRPLVLALGSSRTEVALRPSYLADGPRDPLVFNMARGGVSQVMNLLVLERLLADGVRPDLLLLEVLPSSLAEEGWGTTTPAVTFRDLPESVRYPIGGKAYFYLLKARALPVHKYRRGLMQAYGPPGAPANPDATMWDDTGAGTVMIPEEAKPDQRLRGTHFARGQYLNKLRAYHIAPAADRATRAFLARCRTERIPVVLYLMPESNEFRSWYPPEALRTLDGYLADLRREFPLPLVDARTWLPDEVFWDGHHVLKRGAHAFTTRFANEVITPAMRAGLAARGGASRPGPEPLPGGS